MFNQIIVVVIGPWMDYNTPSFNEIGTNMYKAVVYNNHTLGILFPNNILQVLYGKVHLGGKPWNSEPFNVFDDEIRPATLNDFVNFNVKYHKDYIVQQ